jgi:hypothetical protein
MAMENVWASECVVKREMYAQTNAMLFKTNNNLTLHQLFGGVAQMGNSPYEAYPCGREGRKKMPSNGLLMNRSKRRKR